MKGLAMALAGLVLGTSSALAAPHWTSQLVVPVLDANRQPAGWGYLVGGDAAHPNSANHAFVATPRHVLEQAGVTLQPAAVCHVQIGGNDRSGIDPIGEQQCEVFAVAGGGRDVAVLKVLLNREIARPLARVAPPRWTDDCLATRSYRVRLSSGRFTTQTNCQAPEGDLQVLAGGGTQSGDSGGVVVTPFEGDDADGVQAFGVLIRSSGTKTYVLPFDRIEAWFGAASIVFWKGPWTVPPSHPKLRRTLLLAATAVATGFAMIMANNMRRDAGASVGELKNACQTSGGLYWCPQAQYARWMAGNAANQDLRWHVLSVVLPLWGAGFTYRFW